MSSILGLQKRSRIPEELTKDHGRGSGESETTRSSCDAEDSDATVFVVLEVVDVFLTEVHLADTVDSDELDALFFEVQGDTLDHILVVAKHDDLLVLVFDHVCDDVQQGWYLCSSRLPKQFEQQTKSL